MSSKKKVVFFGTRKTGLMFLEKLYEFHESGRLECVGVYTVDNTWRDKCWWLKSAETDPVEYFCIEKGIQRFSSMDEIVDLELEVGLAVSFPKVVKREVFSSPRLGFINFDAAPLPEYRGQCSPSFAILEGTNYFGCTFIKMEESLDTGPIYIRIIFPVPKHIDAATMDLMAYQKGLEAFPLLLEKIIDDNLISIPQNSINKPQRYFSRKQLYHLLELDLDLPKKEIEKRILALSFPQVLPPPFIKLGSRRFNIVPDKESNE